MGCEIVCLIAKFICVVSVIIYVVCMFGSMGWFGW